MAKDKPKKAPSKAQLKKQAEHRKAVKGALNHLNKDGRKVKAKGDGENEEV